MYKMNYRAIRNIRNNTNEILDDNNEVVASINLDTNNINIISRDEQGILVINVSLSLLNQIIENIN